MSVSYRFICSCLYWVFCTVVRFFELLTYIDSLIAPINISKLWSYVLLCWNFTTSEKYYVMFLDGLFFWVKWKVAKSWPSILSSLVKNKIGFNSTHTTTFAPDVENVDKTSHFYINLWAKQTEKVKPSFCYYRYFYINIKLCKQTTLYSIDRKILNSKGKTQSVK